MRLANLATGAALALATASLSNTAIAADPGVNAAPDGHVTITAKSANLGVGWSWGGGVLTYHHHTYHFSIAGLNVAAVGYSTLVGHGRVYNLHHLRDFDGTYYQSHGEVTAGSGVGGSLYVNGNGVQVRVDDVTKGAQLAGSASGIEFKIER
jgi:hypothetical protein